MVAKGGIHADAAGGFDGNAGNSKLRSGDAVEAVDGGGIAVVVVVGGCRDVKRSEVEARFGVLDWWRIRGSRCHRQNCGWESSEVVMMITHEWDIS